MTTSRRLTSKLREIAQLHEKGVIDAEEYKRMTAALIEGR